MTSGLLFLAVDAGDQDAIARLLEQDDALVNSRNGSGQTPLHVACSKASLPVLELLLSYGAGVNLTTPAAFGGLAPLHIAARYDLVSVARTLVQSGADPNCRAAGTGATALHECAQFGSTQVATWLLSIPGVDVAALDSAGFSAGYLAKKGGHVALARMLLSPSVASTSTPASAGAASSSSSASSASAGASGAALAPKKKPLAPGSAPSKPGTYDLWKQLEREPNYAQNLAAVRDTLEKKEKIAQRKAEALEKKAKTKMW